MPSLSDQSPDLFKGTSTAESEGITLFSTVVKLVALEDGALPATQGRLAHAAFLDIMHAADPALARALHAGSGRRPFTVSPLRGLPRPQDGQVPVARGRTAILARTPEEFEARLPSL